VLQVAGVSSAEGFIGWHGLRNTYDSYLAMQGVASMHLGVDGARHYRDDDALRAPVTISAGERGAGVGLAIPIRAPLWARDAKGAHWGHMKRVWISS